MSRQLIALTRSQCLALLAESDFGRVVLAAAPGQAPLIRPVNYRFDKPSQSIVFRSLEGSKLRNLERNARACFEIDAHDAESQSGWSVIVLGAVERITSPSEQHRMARLNAPTWPPSVNAPWFLIRARTVSGRRLVPLPDSQ